MDTQPQQFQNPGAMPAMVTLPIAYWSSLLDMLMTHPWRDANPIILDIQRQLQDALQAQRSTAREPETQSVRVD